jgi:DNA-binding Lrp family transcriptional regulator
METFTLANRQKLESRLRMLHAFENKQGQYEALRRDQIEKRSGLSHGAVSKHLPKLFEEGYIKGEVRVVDHKRLVNFYSLANPELGTSYAITEEVPDEEIRLYYPKNSKKKGIPAMVREGVLRRSGKTRARVFRRTGPDMLIDAKKMRKLKLERKVQDLQNRLSRLPDAS